MTTTAELAAQVLEADAAMKRYEGPEGHFDSAEVDAERGLEFLNGFGLAAAPALATAYLEAQAELKELQTQWAEQVEEIGGQARVLAETEEEVVELNTALNAKLRVPLIEMPPDLKSKTRDVFRRGWRMGSERQRTADTAALAQAYLALVTAAKEADFWFGEAVGGGENQVTDSLREAMIRLQYAVAVMPYGATNTHRGPAAGPA